MNAFLKYRKDHRLTQERLAELIGSTKASICRYEKDKRVISVDRAKVVNDKIGIPLHKLRPDVWEAA
ncbi:MAG: helix-turn-helix transcriptional regulator [Aestuariivirga sp.]|nr:helix-turn-helix transcriptional regulator [Aestuariivirga sp.]